MNLVKYFRRLARRIFRRFSSKRNSTHQQSHQNHPLIEEVPTPYSPHSSSDDRPCQLPSMSPIDFSTAQHTPTINYHLSTDQLPPPSCSYCNDQFSNRPRPRVPIEVIIPRKTITGFNEQVPHDGSAKLSLNIDKRLISGSGDNTSFSSSAATGKSTEEQGCIEESTIHKQYVESQNGKQYVEEGGNECYLSEKTNNNIRVGPSAMCPKMKRGTSEMCPKIERSPFSIESGDSLLEVRADDFEQRQKLHQRCPWLAENNENDCISAKLSNLNGSQTKNNTQGIVIQNRTPLGSPLRIRLRKEVQARGLPIRLHCQDDSLLLSEFQSLAGSAPTAEEEDASTCCNSKSEDSKPTSSLKVFRLDQLDTSKWRYIDDKTMTATPSSAIYSIGTMESPMVNDYIPGNHMNNNEADLFDDDTTITSIVSLEVLLHPDMKQRIPYTRRSQKVSPEAFSGQNEFQPSDKDSHHFKLASTQLGSAQAGSQTLIRAISSRCKQTMAQQTPRLVGLLKSPFLKLYSAVRARTMRNYQLSEPAYWRESKDRIDINNNLECLQVRDPIPPTNALPPGHRVTMPQTQLLIGPSERSKTTVLITPEPADSMQCFHPSNESAFHNASHSTQLQRLQHWYDANCQLSRTTGDSFGDNYDVISPGGVNFGVDSNGLVERENTENDISSAVFSSSNMELSRDFSAYLEERLNRRSKIDSQNEQHDSRNEQQMKQRIVYTSSYPDPKNGRAKRNLVLGTSKPIRRIILPKDAYEFSSSAPTDLPEPAKSIFEPGNQVLAVTYNAVGHRSPNILATSRLTSYGKNCGTAVHNFVSQASDNSSVRNTDVPNDQFVVNPQVGYSTIKRHNPYQSRAKKRSHRGPLRHTTSSGSQSSNAHSDGVNAVKKVSSDGVVHAASYDLHEQGIPPLDGQQAGVLYCQVSLPNDTEDIEEKAMSIVLRSLKPFSNSDEKFKILCELYRSLLHENVELHQQLQCTPKSRPEDSSTTD